MKIVIVGYGKMGKTIYKEAKKLSIPISKIINDRNELVTYSFKNQEIAMEFTEAKSCLENIKILASKKVNIVCGTTGWFKHLSQVRSLVGENNIGLIYGSNFSLGISIFWKIIKEASTIINKFEDYDIMGHEIHHKYKKDFPSGTALATTKILINNIRRKNRVITNITNKKIQSDDIHLSSSRCGSIIGTHEVLFDSPDDYIKISHVSKKRIQYAKGAIKCAQWIKNKKGFYSIEDHIASILDG